MAKFGVENPLLIAERSMFVRHIQPSPFSRRVILYTEPLTHSRGAQKSALLAKTDVCLSGGYPVMEKWSLILGHTGARLENKGSRSWIFFFLIQYWLLRVRSPISILTQLSFAASFLSSPNSPLKPQKIRTEV